MKKLIVLMLFSTFAYSQGSISNVIPRDKQLHFVAGSLVGAFGNVSTFAITKDSKASFWVGLGMSVLAGVAKEVYDEKQYGGFDTADIAYTVAGGLITNLAINLATKKRKPKMY